jgi:hypothetical protein
MRLGTYLRNIKSSVIFEYLLDGKRSLILSEDVYRDLEQRLSDREYIFAAINGLSEQEQHFLFRIYLSPGQKCTHEDTRIHLLRTFLVYEAVRDEEVYLYPCEDTASAVGDFFTVPQKTLTSPFSTESYGVDTAFIGGCAFQNCIRKKKDADVIKIFYTAFFEKTFLGRELKKRPRPEIQKAVALVLKTAEAAGFLHSVGERLALDRNAFIPSREHFYEALKTLVPQDPDRIVSLAKKGVEIQHSTEDVPLSALLDILAWLGYITLEYGEDSCRLYESRVSAEETPRVKTGHVLPDFSLIIPPDIEPEQFLFFLRIGQIVSFDVVYKGEITRKSITYALSENIPGESIVDFLKQWKALPNIIQTVQDWIDSFHRCFIEGSFMGITESTVSRIMGDSDIAPHLKEVTGYRMFYIPPEYAEVVQRKMQEYGFDTSFSLKDSEEEHRGTPFFPPEEAPAPEIVFAPDLAEEKVRENQSSIYNGEVKKRSLRDTLRLIKYAKIMDLPLVVEYREGLSRGKKMQIRPVEFCSARDEFFEAADTMGNVLRFYITKIEKIGVIIDEF